jgi:hypothetical protein
MTRGGRAARLKPRLQLCSTPTVVDTLGHLPFLCAVPAAGRTLETSA